MRKRKPIFYGKRGAQTDSEWEALAAYHGVESGAALKEQIRLTDELLDEIIKEEQLKEEQ